jgi:hypothetical protein
MKTKSELVATIKGFGYPENEVVLSLDDFFDSIHCSDSCIGANIFPEQAPLPEEFYRLFKELISSGKVDAIFIRPSDIDEPEEWFYTDTVYIIGNLTIHELKEHVQFLYPDEVYDHWLYGQPANANELQPGQKVYSLWWD